MCWGAPNPCLRYRRTHRRRVEIGAELLSLQQQCLGLAPLRTPRSTGRNSKRTAANRRHFEPRCSKCWWSLGTTRRAKRPWARPIRTLPALLQRRCLLDFWGTWRGPPTHAAERAYAVGGFSANQSPVVSRPAGALPPSDCSPVNTLLRSKAVMSGQVLGGGAFLGGGGLPNHRGGLAITPANTEPLQLSLKSCCSACGIQAIGAIGFHRP